MSLADTLAPPSRRSAVDTGAADGRPPRAEGPEGLVWKRFPPADGTQHVGATTMDDGCRPPAVSRLFGRQTELGEILGLITGVHETGAALIVRGEPGIGKSALLIEARALAVAQGMRVLSTHGARAEIDIPFAGLHQLLRPLRGELGALPGRERDVLLASFGSEVAPAQLYAIAIAVLDLLTATAERGPILILVEDMHRLDRCTTDVLAFVARRLESDPIVLLAATPEQLDSSLTGGGLREMELRPLDQAAAEALLDAHAPGLDPALRTRLLLEAAGNPLALVELPLAAAGVEEGVLLPTWLPLTTRLEQAFSARVLELPAATRGLLLIAALNDGDDLLEALGAASLLAGQRISTDDLVPATMARLVEVGDATLRFRHSLVRSAIGRSASISQRHAGHAALADTLAGEPARRVWHRAASTIGTDDALGDELEAMAERAQSRGSFTEAVTALERAAALSSALARRSARLLRAAELAYELGRRDVVARLLDARGASEPADEERTRTMFINETLEDSVPGAPDDAIHVAAMAERAGARGDTDLALRLLAAIGTRCWWGDYEAHPRGRMVEVALGLPVDADEPRLLALLAWAAPLDQAASVAKRLQGLSVSDRTDPEGAHLCAMAATAIGHLRLGAPFFDRAVDGLRAQGRLALLAQALVMRAWSGVRLGDWQRAAADAEEGALLARQTRQPSQLGRALAAEAALAGLLGNDGRAETLASDGESIAARAAARAALFDLRLARGFAALGSGRHADACRQLRTLFDPSDPAYHSVKRLWYVGDLAYAASRAGEAESVRALMPDVERDAVRSASPDIHSALLLARAFLADGADSDGLFRSALAAEPTPPFETARLSLAYGELLRRQRRVTESRHHLRRAYDGFVKLGAPQWAESAQRELRASGETAKRRTPDARRELTPQELQIAALAAGGLSNREIGQRLFLSHRTVGSHLYRLFPKLGITTRSELSTALAEQPS
jgi:DNA-binding CsgD family transcriptional regulator/tetratricopeptide (TPR) repeat protein